MLTIKSHVGNVNRAHSAYVSPVETHDNGAAYVLHHRTMIMGTLWDMQDEVYQSLEDALSDYEALAIKALVEHVKTLRTHYQLEEEVSGNG